LTVPLNKEQFANQYSVLTPHENHLDSFPTTTCTIYALNNNDFATKPVPTEALHLMARNLLEKLTGISFGENNDHSNDQSRDQ
jgi:hypothetical protein